MLGGSFQVQEATVSPGLRPSTAAVEAIGVFNGVPATEEVMERPKPSAHWGIKRVPRQDRPVRSPAAESKFTAIETIRSTLLASPAKLAAASTDCVLVRMASALCGMFDRSFLSKEWVLSAG